MWLHVLSHHITTSWGSSSYGRALALHVRGAGIDTPDLHFCFARWRKLNLILFVSCAIRIHQLHQEIRNYPFAVETQLAKRPLPILHRPWNWIHELNWDHIRSRADYKDFNLNNHSIPIFWQSNSIKDSKQRKGIKRFATIDNQLVQQQLPMLIRELWLNWRVTQDSDSTWSCFNWTFIPILRCHWIVSSMASKMKIKK